MKRNNGIMLGLGCLVVFSAHAMQTHEQMHASTIVKDSNDHLAVYFIYQRMGLDDAVSDNILNVLRPSRPVGPLVTSYEKQIEELSYLTSSDSPNIEAIQKSRGTVERMHGYFTKAFEEVGDAVWRLQDKGYGSYTPSEIDRILIFEGIRQEWLDEVDAQVKVLLQDSKHEQSVEPVLSLKTLSRYSTESPVSRRVKIR